MATQTSNMQKLHFWLRDEVKPGEKRTPILPEHAARMMAAGHLVSVEKSKTRCIPDEEYSKVGCSIVPTGSWTEAPKETVILGLKELPEADTALHHRHVYFAHCFKEQEGWRQLLNRFVQGNGSLWDLEFLTEANGRRVAAFGRCAGFIGMAVGVINWCHQILHPEQEKLPTLRYHNNFKDLVDYVKPILQEAIAKANKTPAVLVIGALGRCGSGATSFAEQVGLSPIKWDMAETAVGGPFKKILEVDILVNCIYLMGNIPAFISMDFIQQHESERNLSVLVDVSCDPNNPANPLPVYNKVTTFFDPNLRVLKGTKPLDVIAIDHLPSLVPFESSQEFADALISHLVECGQTDVWTRASQLFATKSLQAAKDLAKMK